MDKTPLAGPSPSRAAQLLGAIAGLVDDAFRLDHESLRPLWVLPLQQLVYRQFLYLVVIHSVTSAATGQLLRWHAMSRTGEVAERSRFPNAATDLDPPLGASADATGVAAAGTAARSPRS